MFDFIHSNIIAPVLNSFSRNVTEEIILNPYAESSYAAQLHIAQGIFFGIGLLIFIAAIILIILKFGYGWFRSPEYGYSSAHVKAVKWSYSFLIVLTVAAAGLVIYSSVSLEMTKDGAKSLTNDSSSPFYVTSLPEYSGQNQTVRRNTVLRNVASSLGKLQGSIDQLRAERIAILDETPVMALDNVFHLFNSTINYIAYSINQTSDYLVHDLLTKNFANMSSSADPKTISYLNSTFADAKNSTLLPNSNITYASSTLEPIAESFDSMLKTFTEEMKSQYSAFNMYVDRMLESVRGCELPIDAHSIPSFVLAIVIAVTALLSFASFLITRPIGFGYILLLFLIGLMFANAFTVVSSIYYNDLCQSNFTCVCSQALQTVDPTIMVNNTRLGMTVSAFDQFKDDIAGLNATESDKLTKLNDVKNNYARVISSMKPYEDILVSANQTVAQDYAILDTAKQCTSETDKRMGYDICTIAKWNDNILFWNIILSVFVLIAAILAFNLDNIAEFKRMVL